MKSSVIIATKNRAEDLYNTIVSLLEQSCLPDELLIIDDGQLPKENIEQFKKDAQTRRVQFSYYQKDELGLCKSRNLGVEKSMGDILIFLDDDVLLDKDYIKETLAVFSRDENKSVGGVQGAILEDNYNPPCGFKNKLWSCFEVVLGQRSAHFGKLLPSGFGKYQYKNISHDTKVDFLCGCSSYRREVFNTFSFNEDLMGYGYREDIEFSFRVSGEYDLIYAPKARLQHFLSTVSRSSREFLGRQKVLHYHSFFKSNIKRKNIIHYIFFIWSMSGLLTIRVLSYIANPKKTKYEEIKGIVLGYFDVFGRKRISPESLH